MDELIKIFSAESGPEAVVIMSILDGAGIRYTLDPNNPIITRKLWGYTSSYDTTMGPIDFYVHRDDYKEAKELLDAMASGSD